MYEFIRKNYTTYRISVVLWAPFALKTLLGKSSPAQAKHVRRKVEVAGKTLRIRRSQKQRVIDLASYCLQNYFWCPITDKHSNKSWNWFF